MNGSIDGWDVLAHARELAKQGEEFALATVVWRAGPSSGQPGARALISASGQIHGWIGGACAEPVVIREAQRAIAEGTPRLLALGPAETFSSLPEGMVAIPISCQSEGALQVYLEPVVPAPHVVVVGRSPMAHTLVDLVRSLGWTADRHDWEQFTAADIGPRSVVVVATQGHGDEEALEQALAGSPAFVGLVASRKRGETVLGALADRGLPRDRLDRVRVPVGLDLGHTAHREIAVSILAELVQLRAAGALTGGRATADRTAAVAAPSTHATARDPVCGMTVPADASSRPFEHDGVTYYFCCPGCRRAFERDPSAYLAGAAEETDRSATPAQPPVEAHLPSTPAQPPVEA